MPCENKNWVSPACRNEETDPSALRDEFFWLYAINKASVVVNSSIGLLEPKLARRTRHVALAVKRPEGLEKIEIEVGGVGHGRKNRKKGNGGSEIP